MKKEKKLSSSLSFKWNQSLVNLDFNNNKIKFKTYVLYQVCLDKKISKMTNYKNKSSQKKIKKKKSQKRKTLKTFLRICKFIVALRSYILFLHHPSDKLF